MRPKGRRFRAKHSPFRMAAFLTLTLFNKVDGGYRFNNEQFNPAVLQLESHSATAATDGRQGSPGRETWQFKTIKKGKTLLRITASRPWLPKDSIAIFSDVIIVK